MRNRLQAPKSIPGMISLTLLAIPFALPAQTTDKPNLAPTPMMAKDADPDWEVASVKPSDPNETRGQHIDMPGRQVRLLDTTVHQFLLIGYGLQESQLAGEPDWVKTQRWDVVGVPDQDGRANLRQLQGMIRKILTERFGLQIHHEQRQMTIFALTIAKSGPRLIPNTTDPNGWMDQQNGGSSTRHVEVLKNTSMADLALILQFHVDNPVVDQTGLKGRYDFKLQWTPADADSSAPDALPGLFTAIQDQIGLKLERTKGPADVLVLDKITHPTAN